MRGHRVGGCAAFIRARAGHNGRRHTARRFPIDTDTADPGRTIRRSRATRQLSQRDERDAAAGDDHRRCLRRDGGALPRAGGAGRAPAGAAVHLDGAAGGGGSCARGLLALGIKKGDRVGIWAPNRAEWTITQFATAKIGAILVNINPSYRLHELEYALNQSGCSALVYRGRVSDHRLYGDDADALPGTGAQSAPGQLDAHKFPALRHVIRLGDERMPGMWTWGEMLSAREEVAAETLAARQAEQEFDDPINIQYTSGHDGQSQGRDAQPP